MDLTTIQAPVQADLAKIEQILAVKLGSDIPLIQSIYKHIVDSGGKRLRPTLALLAANSCQSPATEQHIEFALIIEFIHTATLLHDDVVDESHMRRGKPSANALWDNQASVLVGDFLLARAFEMLSGLHSLALIELISQTTRDISAGEVLQLINRNDPNTTTERYFTVIKYKTATLFSAACAGAAIVSGTTSHIAPLAEYGLQLGMAFQLVDDALDYQANQAQLGKNLGDDLREGKPTLPLLHALAHGNAQQQDIIRSAICQSQPAEFDKILAIIDSTGGITYTYQLAKSYADKALAALARLPGSVHTDALEQLVLFTLERQH
jgi:octaprenyl-diphosphate synthase